MYSFYKNHTIESLVIIFVVFIVLFIFLFLKQRSMEKILANKKINDFILSPIFLLAIFLLELLSIFFDFGNNKIIASKNLAIFSGFILIYFVYKVFWQKNKDIYNRPNKVNNLENIVSFVLISLPIIIFGSCLEDFSLLKQFG